jgi:mycothiol system anti-sigma-R factor
MAASSETDEMDERPPETPPVDPKCVVVRARLWALIDGELSLPICETLLRHLDDCPDCKDRFCADARLKLLIATKCGGYGVPQGLRVWRPD